MLRRVRLAATSTLVAFFVVLTGTMPLLIWSHSQRIEQTVRSSAGRHDTSRADFTIVPSDMSIGGDVVVCDEEIPDPEVASWCEGVPEGTIILGVDPASPNPQDWGGGQATAVLDLGPVISPTVAVLTVTWPQRDGRGIHSPHEARVATMMWDGVPVWSKRTRDVSESGNYVAARDHDVLATAVIHETGPHTLTLAVPPATAWDVSALSVHLYPMSGGLRGIAYSPFRDCQNPHWGPFPSEDQVVEDIARIAHMTNGIRTYSSLDVMGDIPRIAREHGLSVCAGAWLDREEDEEGNPVPNRNREEIDALIRIAQTEPLDCVIVGNEVLHRGDLTDAELITYIREVKAAVEVPVTTAEVGAELLTHRNVMDELNFYMIHIYPFWDEQSIEGAVDDVVETYLQWQSDFRDVRIVIGETGWPSDGPSRGDAVPSLENQRRYFYDFLAAAEEHGIEYYYFDAFDELWKREWGVGSHWGFEYADRTGKHEVQSVLVPGQHLSATLLVPALQGRNGAPTDAGVPSLADGSQLEHTASARMQDMPHGRFVVYDEYAALEENHFAPSGWMGDWPDLEFFECERTNPYSGEVSVRITYDPQGSNGWAGIYWQEPDGNWGNIDGVGYDLDRATELRFHVRGEQGGERIRFLMGGIWGEHPDSQYPALTTGEVILTDTWKAHSIDLRGRDLSRVIGGFGFATDRCLNPGPITFYLDDIHYVLGEDPGLPAPTPTPDKPYTVDVYRDGDSAWNHFVPSGWMGDIGDIQLDECWTAVTHTGRTAIRVAYLAEGREPSRHCRGDPCNWAGVYWQDSTYNWGDRPGGIDLRGAVNLSFWAKGEEGGEVISFKAGGVGCEEGTHPDSLCPARPLDPSPVVLTNTWQAYTIPLKADLDLSHVVGGFLWSASKWDNQGGRKFYLDDIRYSLNEEVDLGEPPFLPWPALFGPGNDRTFDVALADADNDGDLDLAVGNHAPNQVCWNEGGATFVCEDILGIHPTFDVDWGDMDGDGYVDLVVANGHLYADQPNLVCRNNRDRTFTCTGFSACPAGGHCTTALGDVDDDGDLDVALGIRFEPDVVFLNAGDGTFPVTATTCASPVWTWDLEFGDMDGDSDLDLVVVGDSPDHVCINDGSGAITETRHFTKRHGSTRGVALGDIDGDGDLDIAVGESSMHRSGVYLNNGRGEFTDQLLVGGESVNTHGVALGDANGDGFLDLATATLQEPDVLYFTEPVTSTNGITVVRQVNLGQGPASANAVAFGDVDGDGDLDLAVARDGGQNFVYLSRLAPARIYIPALTK